MTLMSRKVDYSLVILSYLDQHPDGGCAREIANQYGLSKGFVANILKLLCHRGFVTSHRGVKGGYVMRRPADEVNVAELMEALDESFHLAECNKTDGDHLCSVLAICPVKGAVAEIHRRIRDMLRQMTLAEVFRPREPGVAPLLDLHLLSAGSQLVAP